MTKNSNPSILSAEIFTALKERIIRWEYPPGYRITEESLCEEFGVSRSPIREALRMLVENGLVEKDPHRRYTIKQPDLKEIDELYELRLALELYVVEKLARQGMPEETRQKLQQTWEALKEQQPAGHTVDPSICDEEFHETLATATGNALLARQIKSIDERLHFVRIYDITNPERLKLTCEQHLRILECIHVRVPGCAREAMQMNIQEGRKQVEMAVKEALARAYMGIGVGSRSADLSNSSI